MNSRENRKDGEKLWQDEELRRFSEKQLEEYFY